LMFKFTLDSFVLLVFFDGEVWIIEKILTMDYFSALVSVKS
jgi:hypothetical protein